MASLFFWLLAHGINAQLGLWDRLCSRSMNQDQCKEAAEHLWPQQCHCMDGLFMVHRHVFTCTSC